MYRESPSELDNFSVMTIPFEIIQTPFLIIGGTHFLLKSNWWLYLVRDSVCVLKSHHAAPIKRSNEQPSDSEAPTKKLRGEEFSDEIDSRISLAGEGKQKNKLLWIKRYIQKVARFWPTLFILSGVPPFLPSSTDRDINAWQPLTERHNSHVPGNGKAIKIRDIGASLNKN